MKIKLSVYFIFLASLGFAQQGDQEKKRYTLDANQFYGTILRHNPDVSHLINSHLFYLPRI